MILTYSQHSFLVSLFVILLFLIETNNDGKDLQYTKSVNTKIGLMMELEFIRMYKEYQSKE